MPTIDPYPVLTENGPPWMRYVPSVPEYAVLRGTPFKDQSTDYWLQADDPVRRFVFEYDGLTETEAKILDDHYASAKGKAYGFTFVDPRTGDSYAVHYEKYERSHDKNRQIQKRTVTLIATP